MEMMALRLVDTIVGEESVGPVPCIHDKDVEYRLRYWDQNKGEYLYKLMGNQLILSKEVKMTRSYDDTMHELNNFSREWHYFRMELTRKIGDALGLNDYGYARTLSDEFIFYDRFSRLFTNFCLYEGIADFATPAVKINGATIQINSGSKTMRVLGKVAKALDMTEEFEKFRIAHSQIMNQKCVTGTLCLSIHPLDYMTASDNACGWSSCMSWDEHGCYRLGTIEMMNSPMVICAYLSSRHSTYDMGEYSWNSKKWRSWVIVTPDVITVNRHFPYENDELNTIILDWVRELAQENLGWGYVKDKVRIEDAQSEYEFYTDYMYNDMCHSYEMYEGVDAYKNPHMITVNFSGPAMCIRCGERIYGDNEENSNGAGSLLCDNCSGAPVCNCCGTRLGEDNQYEGPDGEMYCEYCFNERFTHVECCGCDVEYEQSQMLQIPYRKEIVIDTLLDNPEFEPIVDDLTCDADSYWFGRANNYRGRRVRDDFFNATLCKDCFKDCGATVQYLDDINALRAQGWVNCDDAVLTEVEDWYSIFRSMGLSWRRTDAHFALYTKFYNRMLEAFREMT